MPMMMINERNESSYVQLEQTFGKVKKNQLFTYVVGSANLTLLCPSFLLQFTDSKSRVETSCQHIATSTVRGCQLVARTVS